MTEDDETDELLLKQFGLKRSDCKMSPDGKGMVCENDKARYACRFRSKMNEDGTFEGGMDCKFEKKQENNI